MTEYVECIFVKVKTRSKKENMKTLVGVVYRPPNTNQYLIQYELTTFYEVCLAMGGG